jgi:hypothetical protein
MGELFRIELSAVKLSGCTHELRGNKEGQLAITRADFRHHRSRLPVQQCGEAISFLLVSVLASDRHRPEYTENQREE